MEKISFDFPQSRNGATNLFGELLASQIDRISPLFQPMTERNLSIHWGSFWGRK
jgi:hypothetical protein